MLSQCAPNLSSNVNVMWNMTYYMFDQSAYALFERTVAPHKSAHSLSLAAIEFMCMYLTVEAYYYSKVNWHIALVISMNNRPNSRAIAASMRIEALRFMRRLMS